jgi:hypothetical protein
MKYEGGVLRSVRLYLYFQNGILKRKVKVKVKDMTYEDGVLRSICLYLYFRKGILKSKGKG